MKNLTKKLFVLGFVLASVLFALQVKAVGAPYTVSATATNITSTSAKLNAVVNPNGGNTNAWFETPTSGPLGFQNIGGGTSNVTLTPYTLTGLTPNTTYQFHVRSQNQYGNTVSSWVYFTTSGGTPPPPSLPSVDLNANPTNISYGSSATLSWNSYNATSCVASGGANGWAGAKPLNGSQSTGALYSTTTFSITCSNSAGSDSDSVTVYVTQAPPPPPQLPSVDLNANPTNIPYGSSATLSWTSYNATSCVASGGTSSWPGQKPLNGSESTGPMTVTKTFNITCSNSAGSDSDSVTVYVTQAPPPPQSPTVNLTANPANVAYGGSTTLSWSSTNATSCYATGGWSGNKPTSGNQTISNLTVDTTFNITCTGSGGSATDSVFVNVGSQPQQNLPVVNLSASQTYVSYGGTTNLSWTSSYATSCYASGGTSSWPGPKATSGSQQSGPIYNTTVFTLTCTNAYGSGSDSVTIYVQNQPDNNLPTINISANPANVDYNGASTISWTSNYATSCVASGGTNGWAGARPTSGTFYTGNLTATTVFTLTCTNSYGSTTASATVTVGNQNNNDNDDKPEVSTDSATSVDENSATLRGELEDLGDDTSARVWFEYGRDEDDLDDDTTKRTLDEEEEFSKQISGLRANTTYYFRAVAENDHGIDRGNIRSFRTDRDGNVGGDNICSSGLCAPQAVTTLATNVGSTSARLNGLGLINGSAFTTGYFQWGRTQSLGNTTGSSNIGTVGSNPYSFSLFGLSSNTTYYYRAVVENQYGISYGDVISFRTSGGSVAGSSTTVVRNTTVVSSNTGTSKPSLVFLSVSGNDQYIRIGDIVDYVIDYENISSKQLRDVVLRVTLPKELGFLEASRGYFSEENNTVVVNIGDLFPGERGSVVVTAEVLPTAEIGKIIVVTANLVYTIVADNTQEEVFAYSKNTVESGINLGGAALFGGGFLPNSLLGWLLLLLLILLIILAARAGYNRPARVVYEERKTTSSNPNF